MNVMLPRLLVTASFASYLRLNVVKDAGICCSCCCLVASVHPLKPRVAGQSRDRQAGNIEITSWFAVKPG